MFFLLWLKRFFFSQNKFIRFTPLVGILSLALAVSALVLAMSVYSGYEATIRQSIVDMTGHLMVSGAKPESQTKLWNKIKNHKQKWTAVVPFLSVKALLAHEGNLSGVFLEGVPSAQNGLDVQVKKNLEKRLIKGKLVLNKSATVIGTGLAKRFNLKPGDFFYIAVPQVSSERAFQAKHQRLYVEGVLDWGFHDFNSRYILVNLQTAQAVLSSSKVTGLRLFMKDSSQAKVLSWQLSQTLGPSYTVKDWQGVIDTLHAGYFSAVRKEKFLIFFILMVLVLAGAFNVFSHLSISVWNQIREISILKVIGGRGSFVFFLLFIQGFFISLVGTVLGIVLGRGLSKGFFYIQNFWQILPSDVYKVNMIAPVLRWTDVLLIFACAQLICFISCFFPARRAHNADLKEGLLYE